MKKTLLMAVSVFGLSTFATDAFAGCDGIYLAARGGIVNHNFGDSSESMGDRYEIDDNAFMASGAIGYRWGYFRFEGEYIWRDKTTKEEVAYGVKSSNEFETQSYMFNVYYDFSPYTMFTPYVMGGLGMTNIKIKYESSVRPSTEYDEDNFTWALGGGISAKVTNRFNVDLGYRFLNMDDVKETSLRAHEVYLGLRYVF